MIPLMLGSVDVIGQAKTVGKTAASLPIFDVLSSGQPRKHWCSRPP